jgi:homogentisate 1,2-dioxygenase
MPFAEKNVDFNQIRFYQKGRFRLETELGPIDVEPGDFVVIPKSLMYREVALTDDNVVVIFEVERSIALAEKLQDELGFGSLFIDYSTMELPEPQSITPAQDTETELRVKYDGTNHSVTYDFDPLSDVVGWLGDPVVYKLNVWDIPSLGSSIGFTSPPSNAVLFAEDKSFFFNVLAAKPFPSEPAPRASYGASAHMNDGDEVWLNHVAEISPETDGTPVAVPAHDRASRAQGPAALPGKSAQADPRNQDQLRHHRAADLDTPSQDGAATRPHNRRAHELLRLARRRRGRRSA